MTTHNISDERSVEIRWDESIKLDKFKHVLSTESESRNKTLEHYPNPNRVILALSQPFLEYMIRTYPYLIVLFLSCISKRIKASVDMYFNRKGVKKFTHTIFSSIIEDVNMTLDARIRLYMEIAPTRWVNRYFFRILVDHLINEEYDALKVAPLVFNLMIIVYNECDIEYNHQPFENVAKLVQATGTLSIVTDYVRLHYNGNNWRHKCDDPYIVHLLSFIDSKSGDILLPVYEARLPDIPAHFNNQQ